MKVFPILSTFGSKNVVGFGVAVPITIEYFE